MPTTSSGSTNAAGSAHTTDTHGTTWAIAAATWRIGAHCARCHRAMLFDEMREVAGAEDAAALLLAAILELGLVRFVHHIHQLCTAIIAFVVCKEINKNLEITPSNLCFSPSFTFHSDLCCALKAIDDDVTAIAAQLPSGRQGAVQDQHARLALNATGDAQGVERVRAGGMRAGIAAAEFRHIPEWRMVIAIRTKRERATLDARREGQQPEVIQRALELSIYLNITIGQSIILVAVRAIQTGRFRLEEVGAIS